VGPLFESAIEPAIRLHCDHTRPEPPDLLMAGVGAVARSRRDRQRGGDSVASAALFADQKENAAPFSEAALRVMRASYLEKLEAL
jgi:hypothetical protein